MALSFDGANDDFTAPDDTSYYATLDPNQSISLSAYVYPEAGTGGVIGKGSSYALYMSGGDLYFDLDSGSVNVNVGSVPLNEWTHVAATYNYTTGDVTGYIDGSSTATASWSGSIPDSTSDLSVGSDGSNYFNGRIDQPRVYSRELSSSEVSSFTNYKCNNRQRTVECDNNPELCETPYNNTAGPEHANYHCNYGQFDDPTADGSYADPADKGTGVCCPRNQVAQRDSLTGEWKCESQTVCGTAPGDTCEYNISASEDAYFNDTRKNSSDDSYCQEQIPNYYDNNDQPSPSKSSACCYVYKQGRFDYWFKDGNVKIYG